MDPLEQIQKKLEAQDALLQKIFLSAEKTRKYFLWTLVGSVIMVVLPLIGILALLPFLMSTLGGGLNGLL